MKPWPIKKLGGYYAEKQGSVNPDKFPTERFDLYSIPAHDAGEPELRLGSEIGSAKQIVTPGDVLLSRIVPHIRRAWVVPPSRGRRMIASGEWIVLRHAEVLPRFLRYFVMSNVFHAAFMQTVAGVGGSLLRAKSSEAAKIPIPVPPLAEQERIVKLLDEADALRRLRAQADIRAAALIPALFHEMFGDPVTNSLKWPTQPLRQLGRIVTGGTPPSVKEGMFGGSIPFITPGDLDANTRQPVRTLTDSGAAEVRVVRAGSTLVCCIGATIGKTDRTWHTSALNQQINAVEWGAGINDEFGLACMKLFAGVVKGRGSQTALPILKKSLFEEICIPVPPLPLQQEFARRVAGIRELAAGQTAARARLEALFQALLHGVFAGEA